MIGKFDKMAGAIMLLLCSLSGFLGNYDAAIALALCAVYFQVSALTDATRKRDA